MPMSGAKLCPRCRKIYRGRACAQCHPPWGAKPQSWAGGYDQTEWDRFRSAWIEDHPFCMDCGLPATVVCHRPGVDYDVDRCNPAAIEGQRCRDCDASVTAKQGAAARWRTPRG